MAFKRGDLLQVVKTATIRLIHLIMSTLARAVTAAFSPAALVLVMITAVITFLVPWQGVGQRVYSGFDPNLLSVNDRGQGQVAGMVFLSPTRATLKAVPGSDPRLDLVDSESDFAATFDITPLSRGQEWNLATVAVQAPQASRYFVVQMGVVNGTVLFHDISISPVDPAGRIGQPIFVDDFIDSNLSKWRRVEGVASLGGPASDRGMTITAAGSTEVGTGTSVLGPLSVPSRYVVTVHFRSADGTPRFKVAIQWLDPVRRSLATVPDWTDWAAFAAPFVPATVSLWHPRKGNALDLQFGFGLKQTIAVVTRDARGNSTRKVLSNFVAGDTYHIGLIWRHARSASLRVTSPGAGTFAYTIDRSSGFGLFDDPFVNLSIETSAAQGTTSSVFVRNMNLIIPGATRYAINVSDWRLAILTKIILGWLACFLIVLALRARRVVRSWRKPIKAVLRRRTLAVLLVLVGLSGLYGLAAQADGHPFDRLTQETAMYVIDQYGLGALYGRSSAAPDAAIRSRSQPWNPAEFAYPPGMAEFFAGVAKVWQYVEGAIHPLRDRAFYAFWKLALSFFIFTSAGLIFLISRHVNGTSSKWAWITALAFALNPAVIFDGPVWGQTNALLSTFLLLSVLGLIKNRPRITWTSLIMAVLLKQTALLVAPLIAIYAVRRFGIRRTLIDAPFGLVVGFAFMAPLVLAGYHPATAYITTAQKIIDFGSSLTHYDTQISADTFPVWVLFSGFANIHGHDRLWASDRNTIGGLGVTYANAGLALFLLAFCVAILAAWRAASPKRGSYRELFAALGLVTVGYVALNTRTSGHYLTLAIPFLLLATSRAALAKRLVQVTAVTGISVISLYGLFMFIAASGEWPVFAVFGSPSTNAVSASVYNVYTSDVFITLFAALLLYVTIQLFIEVLAPPRRPTVATLIPSRSEAERELSVAGH
jgi:hypothetical protein